MTHLSAFVTCIFVAITFHVFAPACRFSEVVNNNFALFMVTVTLTSEPETRNLRRYYFEGMFKLFSIFSNSDLTFTAAPI